MRFFGWQLAIAIAIGSFSAQLRAQDVVGQWAYRRLSKAHEALQENQISEALAHMDEMKGRKHLNDHERALMWQTYGFIYSGQERFKEAAAAFESCLALGALPEEAQLNTQYNLGQLYLSIGKYQKATVTLEGWFEKANNPAPRALFVIAMAYAQDKQFKKGLYYAQQAVAQVEKPDESWLQLALSLCLELEDFAQGEVLLKRLIERMPSSKNYWLQLSAVYNELGDEHRALAVMELAHRQGFLTQAADLLHLAQLYLQQGVPMQGAKLIEGGLHNGSLTKSHKVMRIYATCLIQGRDLERALEPLAYAASLDEDGDLDIQLAQLHMARQAWDQAAVAIEAGLAKAKLTDEPHAHLLLGIAQYSAGRKAAARRAFEQATRFQSTQKAATQWLRSLENR